MAVVAEGVSGYWGVGVQKGIVGLAARNNALWCDTICSTHQGPGEFHEDLWINRKGVPRFYPDAVTLAGADAAVAQTRTISALMESSPGKRWAVKDSFRCLDLHDLGFAPLFDARWLGAPSEASAATASRKPRWRRVEDERGLLEWERSWSGGAQASGPRTFKPALLPEPDIRLVFAVDGGAILGGGVLNQGAGAVGISNVFAVDRKLHAIWEGLAHCARSAFSGLPLVAYEDRQERLEAACRAGFSPVGHLRVWRL